MINATELDILRAALRTLGEGFSELPEFTPEFDQDAVAAVMKPEHGESLDRIMDILEASAAA